MTLCPAAGQDTTQRLHKLGCREVIRAGPAEPTAPSRRLAQGPRADAALESQATGSYLAEYLKQNSQACSDRNL